jgi:hypothetical protein
MISPTGTGTSAAPSPTAAEGLELHLLLRVQRQGVQVLLVGVDLLASASEGLAGELIRSGQVLRVKALILVPVWELLLLLLEQLLLEELLLVLLLHLLLLPAGEGLLLMAVWVLLSVISCMPVRSHPHHLVVAAVVVVVVVVDHLLRLFNQGLHFAHLPLQGLVIDLTDGRSWCVGILVEAPLVWIALEAPLL